MMAKGRVPSSATSEVRSSKAKVVRNSESERLKVVTQDICITLSPCDLLSDINCDFSLKKKMVGEKKECQSAEKHVAVNFDFIKEKCGRKQTFRTSDKCNNNMGTETEESDTQNTDLETIVVGFKPTSFYGSTTQNPIRRIQPNLQHGTVNLNFSENHHDVKRKQCLGVKRKKGKQCNSSEVKKKPKTAIDSKCVKGYSKQDQGSSSVDSLSCQAVEEKSPVNGPIEITKETAPRHQTEYSNTVTNSFQWESESSIAGDNSLKYLGEDSEKSLSDSSSKGLVVWDVKSPVKSQMVAQSEAQSVSSEESLGSALDGLFLKKKGSEYFFTDSIDSHAPDLDQRPCTGSTIKESDEDISTFEMNAGSSTVHQDATLFIKGSVKYLSDKRYYSPQLPSAGESESTSPRSSPDNQASIKRYFKSIQTPKCKTKLVTNGAAHLPPVDSSAESKSRTTPRKKKGIIKKQEQMYLDLGQRDFGHVTCPTCGMVYTRAQPDDEAAHIKHHKSFVSGLRFSGWKNECVLQEYHDGRVIMIRPDDHSLHLKKVEDVRKVVDTELGFVADVPCRRSEAKTFLFIALKKIVGCAVAVQIDQGYPVLPSPENAITPEKQITAWCCSTTPQTAQCGISRIWVHNQYRRRKIATRLLDCVRMNFTYGCMIPRELLAFSDPTPDGKRLAKSYAGTSQFLVFR